MMTTLTMLAALTVAAPPQVETMHAERVKAHALKNCDNRTDVPGDVVRYLFALEREAQIPDIARGLLAAAACNETGYRTTWKGGPIVGDNGASVGMFQFAAWAKRHIRRRGGVGKDPRNDWRASARFYRDHVMRQMPRVRAWCNGRGGYETRQEYLWASAVATATRYPICAKGARDLAGRCTKWRPRCSRKGKGSEGLHWARLRKWREAVTPKLVQR